jgi:hypothetical protein
MNILLLCLGVVWIVGICLLGALAAWTGCDCLDTWCANQLND